MIKWPKYTTSSMNRGALPPPGVHDPLLDATAQLQVQTEDPQHVEQLVQLDRLFARLDGMDESRRAPSEVSELVLA